MTNKILKDFGESICDDLKIKPCGNSFTITEERKESPIKKINFAFRNKRYYVANAQKVKLSFFR